MGGPGHAPVPTGLAGRARRGRRGAAALVLFVTLSSLQCVGDLLHPKVPAVAFAFQSPLSDTVVNVGDTTPPLGCRLTANGRDVGCEVDVRSIVGRRLLLTPERRLMADSIGWTTVELRPLNVNFAVDTIVRTARVHAAVPRLLWVSAGTADTITDIHQAVLFLVLPVTRSGRPLSGVPVTWVQDSGQGVAELFGAGRVRALADGVAVFRATTDTASSTPRHVVVRLATGADPPPGTGRAAAGAAGRHRP